MPKSPSVKVAAPRWIFYVLLFAVAFYPLPFGGIYQWTWAGMAALVGLLLAAWAIALWPRMHSAMFWPSLRWQGGLLLPGLLYLAVVLWTAIQAAPLGIGSVEIWGAAEDVLEPIVAGSLSLAPEKTRAGTIQLLTAGVVFWLAVQFGRDPVLAHRSLWVLTIFGLVYGLYGLAMVLSGLERVLWFEKTSYLGSVTGPYINRNMFAFYAGLGLLSSCCLLLDRIAAVQTKARGILQAVRLTLVTDANVIVCLGVSMLIFLLTIAYTESRGGALSSSFAVAVMVVAMLLRQPRGGVRQRWLAVSGLIVAGLMAYTVTGAHLDGRFDSHFFDDGGRIDAYDVMVAAIADAPLRGYGYGAFAELFFHRNDGAVWLAYNYAHNLYLGAAVQLGLPATAALVASVFLIALACARGIGRRRRFSAFPALGLGVTALAAAHGLVDSPLFVPANAVTFSFLLGLAYAQAFPIWRSSSEPVDR